MLSAIMWMLHQDNQGRGVIEPEILPSDYILDYCKDYLGAVLINFDCTDEYRINTDKYLDLLVDN